MTNCKARYEGGQMVCNRCGTVWDLDDEHPECRTDDGGPEWLDIPAFLRRASIDSREELQKIKGILSDEHKN